MIFKDINTVWIINMSAHALVQAFFVTNSGPGFYISCITIIVMLGTAYYMMSVSMRASVNWIEFITMRLGFSIYAAWLTAATILNITYTLKWTIKANPKTNFWNYEEAYGIVVIWLAFGLYEFV